MTGSPWISAEQYLAEERQAVEKHEYLDGRIVAMSGASKEHVRIVSNLTVELGVRLRDRGCVPMGSDMRVRVASTGLYTYPDLSIVCGEGSFEDDRLDVLLDPIALFEVLSKSTEAYDRGAKFAHYRRIPSLRSYVLVSTSDPRVELYERNEDGGWTLWPYEGLDAAMRIADLDVVVPLEAIFRGVRFADEIERTAE